MQPTEQQIAEVSQRLLEGFTSTTAEAQRGLVEWLRTNGGNPMFNATLCSVLLTAGDMRARQLAVMQLKSNVGRRYAQGIAPIADQVHRTLLQGLEAAGDKWTVNAVTSCISAVVAAEGLPAWRGLIDNLWQFTSNETYRSRALVCIRDICEDSADQIDTPMSEAEPPTADHLVPAMFHLLFALSKTLQQTPTQEALDSVQTLLEALCHLLDSESLIDPVSSINQTVETALPQFLPLLATLPKQCRARTIETYTKLLSYHYLMDGALQGILGVCYSALADEGEVEAVTLRACEFWGDFAFLRAPTKELARTEGMLGQLLGVLLQRMVYTEEEAAMAMEEQAGRGKGDDEDVEQWSVRRAACLALENFSHTLTEEIITPRGCANDWLLQQIGAKMSSKDWKLQESGILALGAISSGAYSALQPHLPTLLAQLLALLTSSSHCLVKSTTCWTLSRFTTSMVTGGDLTASYLSGLLSCMGGSSGVLQESAVSAFTEFVKEHAGLIEKHGMLGHVVNGMGEMLKREAPVRNVSILLDGIGALVHGVGPALHAHGVQEKLLSPLAQLLSTAETESPLLPRILMAVKSCASGLKQEYEPYLQATCAKLRHLVTIFYEGLYGDRDADWSHAGFAFTLLSTLLETLPSSAEAILTDKAGTQFSFIDLASMPFTRPKEVWSTLCRGCGEKLIVLIVKK